MATEFVRETILAIVRDPGSVTSGAVAPLLEPLIERKIHYTSFLAAEKRDAMVREGSEEGLDGLVGEAHARNDKLCRGTDG